MKLTKKEVFSIPNILCYIRILLIPVFIVVYLNAQTTKDYIMVAIIVAVSGFTDMFDGKIARKYDMITELGKFIDPVADKLTQCALVFCLTTRFKLMWLLVVLFIIKEGFMSIMGIYMIQKYNRKLDGAMWYGKVCTAVLFVVMFLLLLVPKLSVAFANTLIIITAAIMVFTLCMYVPVFMNMKKQ